MQVESISSTVPVQVEFDGYVPLVIRFGDRANRLPKYWRTGDFKHSLVEIAVDPLTGSIDKIVVTSISDISTDCYLINDFDMEHVSGVPKMSSKVWEKSQTRVDVEGLVCGSLVGRTFTVALDKSQIPLSLVKCGRVTFLLSPTKKLCGFQVFDLSDREIKNLRFATRE